MRKAQVQYKKWKRTECGRPGKTDIQFQNNGSARRHKRAPSSETSTFE